MDQGFSLSSQEKELADQVILTFFNFHLNSLTEKNSTFDL